MGRTPKQNLPEELSVLLDAIGANIIALRESASMTQAALARSAKISATTLNEIEARRYRDIRLSTLVSIADALGVNVLYLFPPADNRIGSHDSMTLLKASEDILRVWRKLARHS